MISLCERCFPGWKDVEVLSIVPLTPCDQCGIYDNRRPDGIRVHAFRADPRLFAKSDQPRFQNPPSQVSIEGVPIKEVMIDAICGAGFGGGKLAQWAVEKGLAKFTGNQWNEQWAWDRASLGILELDALFAVYGRIKRK